MDASCLLVDQEKNKKILEMYSRRLQEQHFCFFFSNILFVGVLLICSLQYTSDLPQQIPLALLSIANFFTLTLIYFSKVDRDNYYYFLATPIIFLTIFVFILMTVNGELREFEATDSFVYDELARLFTATNGSINKFVNDTKYSYDDIGYPLIRYIFHASDGSNAQLLLFKLILHYATSYLLYLLCGHHYDRPTSVKCALLYLNASVPILYVCSGLKETIFAFFVMLAITPSVSILMKVIAILTTYFFRKVFPFLLLSFYFFKKLRIYFALLCLIPLIYILYSVNFLNTYYLVFMLGFDIRVFAASFVSGVVGGIPSLFFETHTNFVYASTVFL